MADPPKRRWFQIHLSTAIVMMFAAGLALWFDVRVLNHSNEFVEEFGWPTCCYRHVNMENFNKELKRLGAEDAKAPRVDPAMTPLTFDLDFPLEHEWYFGGVVCDFGVALTLLLAVAFVCEYVIRRRRPKFNQLS